MLILIYLTLKSMHCSYLKDTMLYTYALISSFCNDLKLELRLQLRQRLEEDQENDTSGKM